VTSTPAARAATASRSSPSATTTRAISTPWFRSMSNVVTPKWREPTSVIRMVSVPSLGLSEAGQPCVDSTGQLPVKPCGHGVGGYQQLAGLTSIRRLNQEGGPAQQTPGWFQQSLKALFAIISDRPAPK